jgi:hypothetical protein
MAAACFQTFLQDNWTGKVSLCYPPLTPSTRVCSTTGPAVDDSTLALKPIMGNAKRLQDTPSDVLPVSDPLQRALIDALSVDGEVCSCHTLSHIFTTCQVLS